MRKIELVKVLVISCIFKESFRLHTNYLKYDHYKIQLKEVYAIANSFQSGVFLRVESIQ